MTEVVPVSSSAHLTAVPWLLGWPPPAHRTTFAAGLHAGSCAGIALALVRAGLPPRRTLALAAVTCLPAAVAGLLAADTVESRLGRPAQLAALLAGAGAVLGLADRRPTDGAVTPRAAAWAGLAQVAALAPGVSRSGAATTALRLNRVGRAEAQQFSLLMSLPVTAGAAVLTLSRCDRDELRALATPLALGAVAAAVTGHTVTGRVSGRGSQTLVMFALYRLCFATIIAAVGRRRPAPPLEELS